uniref:Uncharacterized protein n=1 Tax=Rhizophora mucronata TaxID=61149 RepID=A0A2P2PNU6_RHIMU
MWAEIRVGLLIKECKDLHTPMHRKMDLRGSLERISTAISCGMQSNIFAIAEV